MTIETGEQDEGHSSEEAADMKKRGAVEPDEEGGGEKRRSGGTYPYFPLDEALAFAKQVRDRGGNEVREDDLLGALKLSRSTKSWIYKLSSAREFGLLVRVGRKEAARVVVTDLAKKLLLPGDDAETLLAKKAAFLTPALYQKLYDRYSGAVLPAQDRLANVLIRDFDLLESVALPAASAFIESAKFAGLVSASGHISTEPAAAAKDPPPSAVPPPLVSEPKSDPSPNLGHTLPVPAEFNVYGYQLRKNLRVDLALPSDLTHQDVKRLHRWLLTLPVDDPPEGGGSP